MSSPQPSPSPSLTSKPPRRVPPPCWTHEETLALIESYHEKWYTLRRGNLKASHWQDVADAVARRCRFAVPSKTSVQCRHKVEKLRKRYRTEKQRAAGNAPNRYSSSWNFFKKMDDMEKGPFVATNTEAAAVDSDDDHEVDEDEDLEDQDDEDGIMNHTYQRMISKNTNGSAAAAAPFRFRIPGGGSVPLGSSKPKNCASFDGNPNIKPNHNTTNLSSDPRFLNTRSGSARGNGKREMDPVAEMVSSIRMLGEGFVKMEQKKIEMAKEMEQMRMEMEMKRTEMILESQQKIVEAFAKGFSAKKKLKRMPSPES